MNIDLLKEYADVAKQIKALTEKQEELKPRVMEHLKRVKVDKYQSEFGTFSIVPFTSQKYSPLVTKLTEDLKELKLKEVQSMVAVREVKDTLRFQ